MNHKLTIALAVLIGLYGCQQESDQAVATAKTNTPVATTVTEVENIAAELTSGLKPSEFSKTVRAQDDFFDYVNGPWVENTEIPADRARWGTFDALREQSDKDIRSLVQEVSAADNVQNGTPTQKIRDYYNSYMDTESANKLGVEAIRSELDKIAAAKSLDDIYRLFSTICAVFDTGLCKDTLHNPKIADGLLQTAHHHSDSNLGRASSSRFEL